MKMAALLEKAGEPLVHVGSLNISLYSLCFFALVLAVFYWATRLVHAVFNRIKTETDERNHYSLYIIERFVHYGVVVTGFVVALSVLGVDLTHLAMIATALSVGIGMGMQSIFNNFFSGFIILFEKSLKVGDYIELDQGLSGRVIEVRVRSTLIRTNDNLDVVVPNSEFVTGRVTNWTHNDVTRRLRVSFGVAYGTDVDLVKKIALEAAMTVPTTLLDDGDRQIDVWLENFGESSLEFVLAVWVDPLLNKRPGALIANYLEAIELAFRKNAIEIPFPQRDIHIRTKV